MPFLSRQENTEGRSVVDTLSIAMAGVKTLNSNPRIRKDVGSRFLIRFIPHFIKDFNIFKGIGIDIVKNRMKIKKS